MSLELHAKGIHDAANQESGLELSGADTLNIAGTMQQRSAALAVDAQQTAQAAGIRQLQGVITQSAGAAPLLRQLGAATTGATATHLSNASKLLGVVAGFAGSALSALSQGKSLAQALLQPKALEAMLGAALPGINPQTLHKSLTTAVQVIQFFKDPSLRAALPLLGSLRGALGTHLGSATSLTDIVLTGLSSAAAGPKFDLTRFLSGSLTALSKDVLHRANLLKAADSTTQALASVQMGGS